MSEKTKTFVGLEDGQVVIRHDRMVGVQYLTPTQARTMAEALMSAARMAEAAQN